MKPILFFLFLFPIVSSAQIITTVAGNGSSGYSGDGGLAINAKISPQDIRFDRHGNIFIADIGNRAIRKIDTAGIISTVYSGSSYDVAIDKKGNLYIADGVGNKINEVDTSGHIFTIAGTGTPGYSGDGGHATLALLNQPSSIDIDIFMLQMVSIT